MLKSPDHAWKIAWLDQHHLNLWVLGTRITQYIESPPIISIIFLYKKSRGPLGP